MTRGEIRGSVTLENNGDRAVVDRGHGVEGDVRPTAVEGIIRRGEPRDSGRTGLHGQDR